MKEGWETNIWPLENLNVERQSETPFRDIDRCSFWGPTCSYIGHGCVRLWVCDYVALERSSPLIHAPPGVQTYKPTIPPSGKLPNPPKNKRSCPGHDWLFYFPTRLHVGTHHWEP